MLNLRFFSRVPSEEKIRLTKMFSIKRKEYAIEGYGDYSFCFLLSLAFSVQLRQLSSTQFNPVQLRQGAYWTTTMPVQCFITSLGACPSMMSHDADLRYSSLAQKLLLQATCSPCSPQWLFLTPPHPQVSHCPSQQMTCPLTAPTLTQHALSDQNGKCRSRSTLQWLPSSWGRVQTT